MGHCGVAPSQLGWLLDEESKMSSARGPGDRRWWPKAQETSKLKSEAEGEASGGENSERRMEDQQ